ncbi:MAG: hypothetical protein K9G13_07075 [Aquiluna sp.]|nr:hypothetical protein [Aquiluna sp.]MCF8546281.1 hypothetical protein [Aquiluna sp.]
MEFLSELEEQINSLIPGSQGQLLVIHGDLRTRLDRAVLGEDFIAGISPSGAVAIPLRAISQTVGAGLPKSVDTNLNQFLSAQKTPVRLEYLSGSKLNRCWLLNVVDKWLRVATTQGVGWLPIQSLNLVLIDPVDNQKQNSSQFANLPSKEK